MNSTKLYGFETDTVWGLGCHPNDIEAVNQIYEIKGRDRSKPLILMSSNIKYLYPYVLNMPEYAKKLIIEHFPGALTLVFEKSSLCPDSITAGKNTVGIRIPNHKGFMDLCESIEGNVLATTSLNYSDKPPVKNYKEALDTFKDKVTIIKPCGKNNTETASTVVLCTGKQPAVLRQGIIYI